MSKLKAKGGGKFKYMSEKDMLELAAKFSPIGMLSGVLRGMQYLILLFRSLFMWYMWRVGDVDVAVLTS